MWLERALERMGGGDVFEQVSRLGWYHKAGQVVISADVANDSNRLAEVRNHELNHHLIASTTPHGLVQAALQGAVDNLRIQDRDPGANKAHSEAKRAIELAANVSNLANEAVATYASLAILPQDARNHAIGRLPPPYREGYELFSAFFASREIDGMDQMWITRTIGARAFQTSIVDRWFELELNASANLAHYLTYPENQPNERLKRILTFLESIGDQELADHIGSYVGERDDELRPSQLANDDIVGISIHEVPEQRLEVCEAIARSVGAIGERPLGVGG